MAADYRVIITAEALADIQAIFDYIEARSPQNAASMVERLLNNIESLDNLSSRHKVVGRSRRTGSPIHAMVVDPFIVYYRVEESPRAVFALTIQHGSRIQPRHFN